MSTGGGVRGTPAGLLDRVKRLLVDRRGVAAIEFAFVVPLLLCMYLVTMEVSQGIESNKKVSRVASMVGDLVTQQQTTSAAELDAILQIGAALLQPYNRSTPKIVITAIEVTDETTPKVKVFWTRKSGGDAALDARCPTPTKGAETTIPAALKTRGSFLVRVEDCLDYKPVITWAAESKKPLGLTAAFDKIPMKETYYLRPRMSAQVTCADC